MLIVLICQEMHWTYIEYTQQPRWFINLLTEKMKLDQKRQEMELKKRKK